MFINRIIVICLLQAIILSCYSGNCQQNGGGALDSEDEDYDFLEPTASALNSPQTNGTNFTVDGVNSSTLQEQADCFGFGSITSKFGWLFNLTPLKSEEIHVDFFISTRQQMRIQVITQDLYGLEWSHYEATKPTVIIVHGFLSRSSASWVVNMTKAFLDRDDVNVITVDWSKGGNSWKYWRAVANTRTVGADLAAFLEALIKKTGAKTKDFHFLGHSLGAHICSYAAVRIGGVRRITGLDPAQPCFVTTDLKMLLDKSDADFVDVIHTNGRKLAQLGLGVPNTCGHQDFYPNGGMQQPGCHIGKKASFFSRVSPVSKARLKKALCNHGRSHLLFTESLKVHDCSLIGHPWDRSNRSISLSIDMPCTKEACVELGINADKYPARGAFYVVTTAEKPYCDEFSSKIDGKAKKIFETASQLAPTTETPKPKKKWYQSG